MLQVSLYIDGLKIFAASESKLERIMKMVKSFMEDLGLQWNPKKCAVAHAKRWYKRLVFQGGELLSRLQYHVLMMVSSTSSFEYLRVICRRISWFWSVQQKSMSDECQLSDQVPCPIGSVKSVCIACSWISYVDTTVASDGT